MKIIVVVLVVVLLQLATSLTKQELLELGKATKKAKQCVPFGVRLHWGASIHDSSSPQKASIRFNTFKECPDVGLLLDSSFILVCPTATNSTYVLQDGKQMTSFVHICSLTRQITFGKEFSYNLIDQETQNTYMQNDITVTLEDPHDTQRTATFIHFSDWAKITKKQGTRPDITIAIRQLQKQNEPIDGIIINGDMAYDLDTSQKQLLQFMELLQGIAMKTPIIVNRGNHQYGEAGKIFCEYFQVYGLCERNATALKVGAAYLALFDPQAGLIPRQYHLYTKKERQSSLIHLEEDLVNNTDRVPIALSHYPLVCSYPTSEHCVPHHKFKEFMPLYVNLHSYYDLLLDYKVPLMLAGHIHTYERSHKLLRGYKYSQVVSNSSIQFDREKDEFIVQVIEGVAGSDQDLFGDYTNTNNGQKEEIQPFVAAYHLHSIGFGKITISQKDIHYQHWALSQQNDLTLVDQFTIDLLKTRSNLSEKDEL